MCADITKKFEQDVARKLWGNARASYNAPTRNKKDRVQSFVLKDPKGVGVDLRISAEGYPAPIAFYRMSTAGILCGADPLVDLSLNWTIEIIVDAIRLKEFEAKHPGRLTATFTSEPKSFGRMLAKIGHSQVMTALDHGDFSPICLPYILGDKSNISYVVGGGPTNDPPQPASGYSLRTIQISTNEGTLIVVEVRLLANNDTPTYHVVVGSVNGKEKMERVNEKLSKIYPPEKGPSFDLGNAPAGYHGEPSVWPVQT